MADSEAMDQVAEAPATETDLEDALQAIFEGLQFARFDEQSSEIETDDFQDQLVALAGCESVRTYRGAGLMTDNRGVVVRMRNGTEFQIQIVRSN